MKRLRENAMLEAEISVNGDVFVEGHHVGQLAGFRFTLANAAEGQEAKAMLSAAQKALALEFEARAARLHAAGNGDLALTSEGVVRWLGDPVARLTSTDHILHPRVILLADEQLTGPARDHVAARIERFVNHHIATVLKPLDDLSRTEDLEGLAKGLAFQLVENLGVLFRRDVAEEVKSLSQEHRAALRKLGVRFGAYHVFMPALLKPAPAELITLLWALKNDAMDKPGYGDLIPVLAAGRTSVVTDHAIERNFYRLAGFRFLGKRAVRIDILERLADLIRPLLQWKPETGKRPDGAYDGRRFVTTPAMLSILGATPDDMEEILKGLGYRADSVTAEEAATFLAAQDAKAAPAEGAAAPAAAEASAEDDTADSDAGQEQEEQPAEAAAPADAAPVEAAAAEATPADAAAAGEASAEETAPKPVLLWRPGGRHEREPRQNAGPRRDNRGPRDQNRDQNRGENRGEGRGEGRGDRNQGANRGGNRDRAQGERNQGDRAQGDRKEQRFGGKPGGKPHRDRDENRHGGGGKPHNDRNNKVMSAAPPRKEKPIDPDSPFAKLAILKDQMKK